MDDEFMRLKRVVDHIEKTTGAKNPTQDEVMQIEALKAGLGILRRFVVAIEDIADSAKNRR